MPKPKLAASRFVICVDNKGYKASLEKRKIYVALSDATALKHGHVRSSTNPEKTASLRKAILKAA